jgi:adenylate cyclase
MRTRHTYMLLVAVVLVSAYVLRMIDPTPVARLRLLAFDAYQQLQPRKYDPGRIPVRIVDIDEPSLARLGQWPWPRSLIADITTRLMESGAAAVAFDLVFVEPDRVSLSDLIKRLPKDTTLEALAGKLVEAPAGDRMLAEAIAAAPVVLGFIAAAQASGALPVPHAGFATAGDDARQFLPAFAGASASISALQQAAKGSGALNWIPEYDQVVRHLPLMVRVGDRLYPSLAAEAVRVAQGASGYLIKASGASGEESFGTKTGITHVRIGNAIVPTDANAQMWLRFSHSDHRRYIPAWSLLDGRVARENIEGHIILVGTSAPGLFDLRTTPLDAAVPGVEIHAQAIEQILLADHLRRPDFATGAELSFMILFGLLLSALVYRSAAIWSAFLGVMAIASGIAISWAAYVRYAWLFDPVYATLILTLLYISTTVHVYFSTEIERNTIRNAFTHYLAPVLVEELASHPQKLRLGGETRIVTVYRSDLANFSRLAEALQPRELVALMNEYLSAMTDIIMAHGGFVDKYIGDAIDGVFGAPLDDPEQALNAVKAALSCQKKLRDMNVAGLPALRGQMLHQRIGLHTGEAIVGNIGSQQRFNYTVMGDAANLASRLEGANKMYGTSILVSEATADHAGACISWRELDIIQVVGKAEHVRIYEPLALAADRTQQQATFAAAYAEGLARWRTKDIAGAIESFDRVAECDPPSRLFCERARKLLCKTLPSNWIPVNVLETK